MELDTAAIASVQGCVKAWRRATKGNPPPGLPWEDFEQECYLAVLQDEDFDPDRGAKGPRINALCRRVFLDTCREYDRKPKEFTGWGGAAGGELGEMDYNRHLDVAVEDPPFQVDADDFLASLTPEDRDLVERVKADGLTGKDQPAARRKETRRLKKLRDQL